MLVFIKDLFLFFFMKKGLFLRFFMKKGPFVFFIKHSLLTGWFIFETKLKSHKEPEADHINARMAKNGGQAFGIVLGMVEKYLISI